MSRLSTAVVASLLITSSVALPASAQEATDVEAPATRTARHDADGTPRQDLGFPELPPVRADSPMDSMLFADRAGPIPPETSQGGGDATPVQFMITGGGTGTNTGLNEFIYYQVPDDYFPEGEPIPLVIAYHGFGGSANSVGLLSTIDEECNTRGWLYLSVTGGDDQLFGSRICQANVDAAVQWMLANFNVDHDRIYMVGFSMGAGVTASFTARHRDPTGLMIAATGYVAGTYDLVAGYNTGTSGIQAWMVNPFNFGGPPASKLFAYLQASTMYHDPATYLPLPGTLLPELSMARNLHDVPAYFVWDALDTVTLVTPHNPVMVSFLQSLGATVDSNQVVSQGNPHHWSILDEADLFDFFTGKTVERYPSDFLALFDGDPNWQNPNTSDGYGRVSWCELYVRRANELARVEGSADTLTGHVTVDNVDNATSLVIHMDDAEIEGIWPVRVTVTNIDDEPISVALTGHADRERRRLLDPRRAGRGRSLLDRRPVVRPQPGRHRRQPDPGHRRAERRQQRLQLPDRVHGRAAHRHLQRPEQDHAEPRGAGGDPVPAPRRERRPFAHRLDPQRPGPPGRAPGDAGRAGRPGRQPGHGHQRLGPRDRVTPAGRAGRLAAGAAPPVE